MLDLHTGRMLLYIIIKGHHSFKLTFSRVNITKQWNLNNTIELLKKELLYQHSPLILNFKDLKQLSNITSFKGIILWSLLIQKHFNDYLPLVIKFTRI